VKSLIAVFIFLASFLMGAFLIGLGIFLGGITHTEIPPAIRADGIVVLTGGTQRISDAVDLLASNKGKRLLISGVHPRNTQDELIKATPDLKIWYNCCVDLDYLARNTIGNAIETRRWVKNHQFSSLIVVTSNYHMPRALLELSHAMPHTQLVPFSVIAASDQDHYFMSMITRTRLFLIEYVKFLTAKSRMVFESDPESSYLSVLTSGGRKPVYETPPKL
jgi:uncharacterized SAM-binding protein YcdF (DUF218 family)